MSDENENNDQNQGFPDGEEGKHDKYFKGTSQGSDKDKKTNKNLSDKKEKKN